MNNNFSKNLGLIIRAIRTKHKDEIVLDRLAERSGLTKRYIQIIERGERNITVINLFPLANALDVPIIQLIEYLNYTLEHGLYQTFFLKHYQLRKLDGLKRIKYVIQYLNVMNS